MSYRIITIPETESTNTYLKALAADGERDLCVIAKRQTGGRGRLGRTFESPDGGLYMSFVPASDSDPAGECITAKAAVAAVRAVERLTGLNVMIKWVNDLYVGGLKLAGILAEGAVDPAAGSHEYMIIGIGVNLTDGCLPKSLGNIATSVEAAGGKVPAPAELAREILREFEACGDFREEYARRQLLLGKTVTAHRGNETFNATAEALADDMSMILRLEDGTRVAVNSGEISLRIPEADRG